MTLQSRACLTMNDPAELVPIGCSRLRSDGCRRTALLAATAALLQVSPAAAALIQTVERQPSPEKQIAQSTGVQIRPSQGFAGQNSGAFPNFFDFLGGFAIPVPSLTPFGSDDEGDDKKKKEEKDKQAATGTTTPATQN